MWIVKRKIENKNGKTDWLDFYQFRSPSNKQLQQTNPKMLIKENHFCQQSIKYQIKERRRRRKLLSRTCKLQIAGYLLSSCLPIPTKKRKIWGPPQLSRFVYNFSCGLRSESQARQLCLFHLWSMYYICHCIEKRNKIKRGRVWPIFLNKIKYG